MARGNSGRIVLELDPDFKKELYDALDKDRLTLREWFINEANRYLKERNQLRLFETIGRRGRAKTPEERVKQK